MSTALRAGVGLLALLVVATACTGGSSTRARGADRRNDSTEVDIGVEDVNRGGTNGTNGTGGRRTPPPAPTPLTAADFVLTAGPETAGFSEDPPRPASGPDSATSAPSSIFDGAVATCAGATEAQIGAVSTGDADGPVFTHDTSGADLRSFASVYADTATVAGHREIVRLDRFAGCYGRALVDELDSDELGATLIGTETVPPPPGATGRITVTIDLVTAQQQSFRTYVDLVMIFTGRVEGAITLVTPFEPADPALLAMLTAQVESKIAAQ
ncbi:hypothetical protein [Parafrankia discariae]|uniref:hypothetical protein n=1 Tax=Parafrankia discariae TaxID=365528 RepID=UPI000371124B|nr:hypothetical protein [Parafrankia discariae]